MKKFLAIVLAAVTALSVAFAFAGCSKEKSDLESVQEKGKLVIGMTLFAPMDYYADDNEKELTGFEVEFGKAVCEKLGVEAEFQVISWEAKENELNAGNIDCIWNGLTITPERQETMSISNPYMANKQVICVKSENAEKYAAEGALKGLSVVAEKESAGEEVATTDKFFTGANAVNYTPVESMAKAMMEVKAGTADACVIDYVTSIGSIGEGTDYSDLKMIDSISFADEQYGIAFRKGSDLTAKVNEIMSELQADGTLQKIADKYKLGDQLIVSE